MPTSQGAFSAINNRLLGPNFTHDDAGRLTKYGAWDIEHDDEGRLWKLTRNVSGQQHTTEYRYDGNGRRVMRFEPGASNPVVYVYDIDGKLMAEYGGAAETPGTYFPITDHLGSTRLVLNASGGVESRHDYVPFGEEIPASVGSRAVAGYEISSFLKQKFTGKERDEGVHEAGFDYFLARYYSSPLGRFATPDAPFADQSTADPQSWNLYAYVRNNPLKFIDSSGRDCVNFDDGTQGDDGRGTPCAGAQLGTGGTYSVGLPMSELGLLMLSHTGNQLGSSHQWAVVVSEGGQSADAVWGAKTTADGVWMAARWGYGRILTRLTLRGLGRPKWAYGAGGFVNWLKNLQKSGAKLTKNEADAIIEHPGTPWNKPHLNVGKEGQVYLEVPVDYAHPSIPRGSEVGPR